MAKKKDSSFINMVLTLFIVSLISSTTLGIIYKITKEPIAEAKLERRLSILKEVLPEFDNNPSKEAYIKNFDDIILKFYPAKMQGELVGIAIESFSNDGFNGEIRLMVGFLPSGRIKDIAVLEHKETPGLGDKMETRKSDFHVQFQGKKPDEFKLNVKKYGGDVDAITASTVSSKAYCNAVQRAYDVFMKGGEK